MNEDQEVKECVKLDMQSGIIVLLDRKNLLANMLNLESIISFSILNLN